MKKRSNLLKGTIFFLAWFLSLQVFAQNLTISGKITDASDGNSLPGVTITVKGATVGTTSNIDGKFSIDAPMGAILEFSFIGYATQEIKVESQKINVSLVPSVTPLNEVVVIGYGQVKKGDATGSVTAVSVDDFKQGAITNPIELMSGKTAGVQVTQNSGAPGSGATIRIRGGSSLSASNDPLIVIDGVPTDNVGISGTRNSLSMLNPADIETFTVLKDASAAAIYGARASNGVILITTKKGKSTQYGSLLPFTVEYNGNFSLYTIPKTLDLLDGDEFRSIIAERHPDHVDMLGTANTDWQKEIYRSAFGHDHNLSIGGTLKTMPYRFSAGFADYDGILKTDNMKRTNIALNLNPSLFDDHLKINVSAKGMFVKQRFGEEDAIGAAVEMDPSQSVNIESDLYGGYYTWLSNSGIPSTQGTDNPVALLNLTDDNSDVNRFIGNAQFDYKVHFLPDLHLNLNVGMDYSEANGTVFVPGYAAFAWNETNGGGTMTTYDQTKRNELVDFTLNYIKEVPSIKSRFDVLAGYSWQHFRRDAHSYTTNDTTSENYVSLLVSDDSDNPTENYLVSFFGRLNYTFNNKYLLTFTLRNDGSSRFSPDNRWGLFPSVAAAWRIMDEPWMKSADKLSELKLRLGWGITGQQDITDNDYPYLASYTISNEHAMYGFDNNFYYTLRPDGYDENIKWEETTTLNVGIDYGFFNERLYGSLDFYKRETKDLLNYITVPAGSNLTNYLLTNIGNLENKGAEFSINGIIYSKKDLFWEVGLNATYNQNEITKLTATDDPTYIGVQTGGVSGGVGNTVEIHSVGYSAFSYYVYEQVYDNDGKPIEGLYVDRNEDGIINENDMYRYKDAMPDFFLGISSRFKYKEWDFSFGGRASFNNWVYNNNAAHLSNYDRLYRSEGPYLGNITSESSEIGFVTVQRWSDYFIQKANYFKMDYITLGYTFDKMLKDRFKLRVAATVNNAFCITPYDGIDPEIYGGIDNRIYPTTRAFVLSLNLAF